MEYRVEAPIYMQVIRDIKKRIVRRQLLPGEKLPSNRELAVLYKVNPNTEYSAVAEPPNLMK